MSDSADKLVTISGRAIGTGQPAYIVAELSGNHGQSLSQALESVRAAKEAGADALKIQTYTPDTLTIDSPRPEFRIGGTVWNGMTLYELYRQAFTPWEWHHEIFAEAQKIGLDCFSTPFDKSAVDFLEQFDPPCYKIASFEACHHELLEYVANKGRPVILSTGMCSREEIEEAITTLTRAGTKDMILLRCSSAYPSVAADMNLRVIRDMIENFKVPVGLSDHSLSPFVPAVAVALGACVIEKHFTLSRQLKGPDTKFSLEPAEFAELVRSVRETELALGRMAYGPSEAEQGSLVFRRSIFAVRDIKKGELLSAESVQVIRPGHGLHPRHLRDVLGKRAAADIERGTPISWQLVS